MSFDMFDPMRMITVMYDSALTSCTHMSADFTCTLKLEMRGFARSERPREWNEWQHMAAHAWTSTAASNIHEPCSQVPFLVQAPTGALLEIFGRNFEPHFELCSPVSRFPCLLTF